MERESSNGDALRFSDRRRISQQSYTDFNIPFPIKLHTLLENENGLVIAWLAHGKSFRVEDSHRFIHEIILKYFKRKNLLIIHEYHENYLDSYFTFIRLQND